MPIEGAAAADRLQAVTTCSRTLATVAVSKGSSSFKTEHMLAPHSLIEVLDVNLQSSRWWLSGESGQSALHSSGSVLRTHYYLKENTQLRAVTER